MNGCMPTANIKSRYLKTITNMNTTWDRNDNKAKSDIILSISPSELKQVKECVTSREVWLKLENIYQSKRPVRKVTLLKQLTLQRMEDGRDVRKYVNKFFDTVDNLSEMEVIINLDLLAIMLLYSLLSNLDNFRCAIESQDELPGNASHKTIQKSDVRKNNSQNTVQNDMIVKKDTCKRWNSNKNRNETSEEKFKFKCYRCRKFGHKAADYTDEKGQQIIKKVEDVSLWASEESLRQNTALDSF